MLENGWLLKAEDVISTSSPLPKLSSWLWESLPTSDQESKQPTIGSTLLTEWLTLKHSYPLLSSLGQTWRSSRNRWNNCWNQGLGTWKVVWVWLKLYTTKMIFWLDHVTLLGPWTVMKETWNMHVHFGLHSYTQVIHQKKKELLSTWCSFSLSPRMNTHRS